MAISFPIHLQTDFQERQFHHHDLRNGRNLRVAGDQSGTRSLEQINATGRCPFTVDLNIDPIGLLLKELRYEMDGISPKPFSGFVCIGDPPYAT